MQLNIYKYEFSLLEKTKKENTLSFHVMFLGGLDLER